MNIHILKQDAILAGMKAEAFDGALKLFGAAAMPEIVEAFRLTRQKQAGGPSTSRRQKQDLERRAAAVGIGSAQLEAIVRLFGEEIVSGIVEDKERIVKAKAKMFSGTLKTDVDELERRRKLVDIPAWLWDRLTRHMSQETLAEWVNAEFSSRDLKAISGGKIDGFWGTAHNAAPSAKDTTSAADGERDKFWGTYRKGAK